MKKLLLYAGLLALPGTMCAQVQVPAQPAQGNEPGISRQQADAMLNELRQIRELLERQQQAADKEGEKPKRAALNLKGAESIGNKRAPVTMVEFTDYQCPYCQRFYTSTFPELKKNFIDTGKVRFYSLDYPLEFHPNALRAAEAGRCAKEQDRFWQFRDFMASNPDKLLLPDLLENAGRLKMDTKRFQACMESGKYKDTIETERKQALRMGADGTPAFVIGKSGPDGVEGELIIGAYPYGVFAQKLEELGAK